jgi:hypothetical protein
MRIGEAFAQFISELHFGNVCKAVGNLFSNVKNSFGNKETSREMGSVPDCHKTSELRDAHQIGSSIFGNSPASSFESPERGSWFDAHNREVDDLTSQTKSAMKAFFEGPLPASINEQNDQVANMTLPEAKELLGIRDGEETRLDAQERGQILKNQANGIYFGSREPSSDQHDKFHHMERKIQRAIKLVEESDFKPIPEPKMT